MNKERQRKSTVGQIINLALCTLLLSAPSAQAQAQGQTQAQEPGPQATSAALNPFEQQLCQWLDQGDSKSAYAAIAGQLKEARKNKTITPSLLYMAAFSEYEQGNFANAARYLQEIAELPDFDKKNTNSTLTDQIILNRAIGECYYRQRKYAEAEKYYNLALLCGSTYRLSKEMFWKALLAVT